MKSAVSALPALSRAVFYLAIAVAIVGAAIWLNRSGDGGWVRYHIDPQAALYVPSHNHAITETVCGGDHPEQEIQQQADRAGYSESHRQAGDNFFARGRYDDAVRCYERAIEQDENNALAHYGLGRVHLKLAQFDRARECFERAKEADRRMVNAYVALGLTYYCTGEFDKARNQWLAALQFDPKHSYAQALIASLPR